MSDEHRPGVRNTEVAFWKPALFTGLITIIALLLIPFRREVAGAVVRAVAYIVWSFDILGSVIPQQVLWVCLLLVILYIAVGSFYGKSSKGAQSKDKAAQLTGPVEAITKWVEQRERGTYFKWRIANMLGKVYQSIRETASHGTSSRIPLPPSGVQSYLDAGLNTSYVDYAVPSPLGKGKSTPLDVELEQVLDYLEEQMEIKHEREHQ